MEQQSITTFKLIMNSQGQEYVMDFAIPRAITKADSEEIGRMMRTAMVTLAKLPVDNAITIEVAKDVE